MRKKQNLLVIAGAGSAIDFGMPSADDVHTILSQAAAQFFPLVSEPTKNLYDFLYEQIAGYWSAHVPAHLGKLPNFEDVLGAISELAATRPAGIFTGALGAFIKANGFPDVVHIGTPKPVDGSVLAHLGEHLVDALLDDFRNRCRNPNPADADNVKRFQSFFAALRDAFDVAVVTTNYDDLIYRALPGMETGFDLGGDDLFKPGRIMHRRTWPCLLHQHGSVHFDMDMIDGDLHVIKWQEDMTHGFHQNSFGRSRGAGASGSQFPTSSIIAGYDKNEQIERQPFRTYYSELDRLVYDSDGVLSLGFSFLDAHIRQAFGGYRDGRDRQVVVIDYAENDVMTACSGFVDQRTTAMRAVRIFRADQHRMVSLGHSTSDTVEALKDAREFERSTDSGRRLSLWYNGMLEACLNAEKIVQELKSAF